MYIISHKFVHACVCTDLHVCTVCSVSYIRVETCIYMYVQAFTCVRALCMCLLYEQDIYTCKRGREVSGIWDACKKKKQHLQIYAYMCVKKNSKKKLREKDMLRT